MDVTFVLEESGVTATVEVPCEADVAAAKEVACTALAVSPASVEMRIGTQVLEGTCRLQDTAFGAGVQVVLARRFADIKCPAEYGEDAEHLSLSRCGTLCVFSSEMTGRVGGFDTETFDAVFSFEVDSEVRSPPAVSQCKTRCYLPCWDDLRMVALPGGKVVRKVDGRSYAVFACGSVVVSQDEDGVSVYDEDLTLLRFVSQKGFMNTALSDCGGWAIISSEKEEKARLWDGNTGKAVACVLAKLCEGVALSRSASVFAVVEEENTVHLYDWSGAALRSVDVDGTVEGIQFTPCGKYFVVKVDVEACTDGTDDDEEYDDRDDYDAQLHQYDVATMSCVRVIPLAHYGSFAISPCSRVVVFGCEATNSIFDATGAIATRHLYPHNSE